MESPFRHVLFTNHIPSVSEATRIRAWCKKPASELAQLNGEVFKLEAALASLTRQRDELRDLVDAHRALLSPIRQVPPEILQHIFVLCLPSNGNPRMHHSEAPLLLGRICSRWRKVVMGTAELWASIHVTVSPGSTRKAGGFSLISSPHQPDVRRHDFVRAWLERSGNLPIDFSLHSQPSESTFPLVSSPSTFLTAILPLSSRWRRIELEVSASDLEVLRDLESKDIPSLEYFAFHTSKARNHWNVAVPDTDDQLATSLAFLSAAPRLYRFSFDRAYSGIPLSLPWNQITELCVLNATLDIGSVLPFLTDCPQLCKCTFRYADYTRPVPIRRISLPRLEELSLHSFVPHGLELRNTIFHLYDYLDAPMLRDLQVEASSGHPARNFVRPIANLISRSSCPIEKLNLRGVKFELEDLARCLQLTPHLRELGINRIDVWGRWGQPELIPIGDVLRVLTPANEIPEQSTCLCPRLQVVSFGDLQRSMIPALLAFLHSRLSPVSGVDRLQSANLQFYESLEREERAEILRLAESTGLNIKITDKPRA